VSSSQEPDWASQLVDTFESAVASVRSKTADPATRIIKYAVFAVMASGLALMIFVLLTIGLVRAIDAILPVWLAYLVLSVSFFGVGAILWRQRRA
jgi:Putative Actinobacterial Holin-X, holin superfamily III